MGYRKYAADYEIEYVERLGKKRPQSRRIYVGPYFVFDRSAQEIKKLRRVYIVLCLLAAAFLIVPMCIDCGSTRTLYVQLPAAFAWIGWVLSAFSVWNLCTAKEKMEREQNDGIYERMSGASLSMLLLCLVASIGSLIYLIKHGFSALDALVLLCDLGAALTAWQMFSRRKGLATHPVENPEKPQTKKK